MQEVGTPITPAPDQMARQRELLRQSEERGLGDWQLTVASSQIRVLPQLLPRLAFDSGTTMSVAIPGSHAVDTLDSLRHKHMTD